MNFDDYEMLPTTSAATNMTAGAIAGVLEHCVMYPLDSVKVSIRCLRGKCFLNCGPQRPRNCTHSDQKTSAAGPGAIECDITSISHASDVMFSGYCAKSI